MRRMILGVLTAIIAAFVLQRGLAGVAVGDSVFDRERLERARAEGQTLRETVVGLARIPDDVSPELAAGTIEHLTVVGTLMVPQAVYDALHGRLSVSGATVVR
ncbi:MAG TPA: hypothetical protein VFB58_13915 [Chloroflexota bacterium]|nr:hypothetical protein [Chloroflexota bacterium]